MSNDNEMKVLTKSKCRFSLFSVARKVTSTPTINRSSTLQSLRQASGDTFHRQQTHDGDKSCVGHDIALLSRVRGGTEQQVSHFAECAEEPNNKSRTSQRNQTKDSHCSECADSRVSDRDRQLEFLAELTKRARCEVIR